jgi:hypothetical protein
LEKPNTGRGLLKVFVGLVRILPDAMSCGGIARDVMEEGERMARGAAKELDGGL